LNPLLSLFLRAVLGVAGGAVTILPRRIELRLGAAIGSGARRLDRKRRPIAEENMRRCLPELSPEERAALLRENYAHYGTLALEILHLFSPFRGHYAAYVRRNYQLHGYEHWKKAHDRGRGVLFISAHLANWEFMVAGPAQQGVAPLTMATRHLKPEWLHRKIVGTRKSCGVRSTYGARVMGVVAKALKNGESVGFVLDQYESSQAAVPSRFFTATVATLGIVGVLALRFKPAVIPVRQERGPDGVIHITIEPEIDYSTLPQTPAALTQEFVSRVEGWIRRRPQEWLWVHRRFKNAVWDSINHQPGPPQTTGSVLC
jgi:KDO2-lipid IV(A) lauroyltransferase